jgi:hypothetical protein
MHPGNINATTVVILLISCAVYRERRWRYRFRYWKSSEGKVIGYRRPDDSGMMVIEFFVGEERRECHPSFVLYNNKIGTILPILYDPDSVESILHTTRHRWFLMWLLLIVSLLMLLPALATWG